MVYDKGLANAIEQKYGRNARGNDGGEVLVCEIDNEDPTHERGHTYNFRMPALPYARYDELGRRIRDDGKLKRSELTPAGSVFRDF